MDHRHQTILAAGEVRIGRGTNAVQRLQTLQADGRGLDAQMLTTLLGAHLAENKVEEALALFAKMQAGELAQPTEVTYTVMIGELSNRRMPEKAAMLLKEMHHAQVPILPHKLDILYTIIIRAFAAAKDSQSMLRMIRDLYSVHHAEPSATIWVTLFRALTQLHQGARAIPFITNLRRSSGPQRPIALWNAAMHLYAATMSQRTLKEAEDLMRDLIERGPKPDQTTWECLVSGCAALAQFSRAKYWLEQCQLPEGTVMLLSDFSSAGRVEG